MFCIRPLCGGTAPCVGQMRDKETGVNVGAKATDLRGGGLVGRSFSSDSSLC